MGYKTKVNIVRKYELPQEILDFIKQNPINHSEGYNRWYSLNGKLYPGTKKN